MVGNHVTSVESDAISMTTEKDMDSEFDLYNLLQSGVQTDDLGESSHSMNDKNVDDFVDLFEFLLQNEKTNTVPAEELISEQPTTDNNNIIVGKKRTYETSSDSATVPSDHSGYTKVKRRHRVTVTSDSESDSGSTTQDMNDKEKHVLRRLKNNVASRRSRQTRKQKFVNMEKKAEELEIANAELRDRVTMLEHLAKEMKDNLIKCMTK
ncbi:hypothetical protein LSH36_243g02007 [Paralvinella palmiformis]|uniref:Basic leucine zipper transcriptional factor ATF-like n=1 Tax=Paralvinella palmiformis TaxID=53620 RepID=A0AAD9JLA6_9ANNE|nr:hypothetical protein LSH36_243g02007 [Paralvinella palmiformis]